MHPPTTPPVEKSPDSAAPPNQESTTPPVFSSSTRGAQGKGPSPEEGIRLTTRAIRDTEGWRLANDRECRTSIVTRWRRLSSQIHTVSHDLRERQARGESLPSDDIVILENMRLLETSDREIREALRSLRGPGVLREGNTVSPRSYLVAVSFLDAVELNISEEDLSRYLEGVQQLPSGTDCHPVREISEST